MRGGGRAGEKVKEVSTVSAKFMNFLLSAKLIHASREGGGGLRDTLGRAPEHPNILKI